MGIDGQVVTIDVARGQKEVVDRGLIDQATQRLDRLEAGDAAGARGHREVDHEVARKRHARQAQEVGRARNQGELVGVGGQVRIVDRQDGVGRIEAERRWGVTDAPDLAVERNVRGVHG